VFRQALLGKHLFLFGNDLFFSPLSSLHFYHKPLGTSPFLLNIPPTETPPPRFFVFEVLPYLLTFFDSNLSPAPLIRRMQRPLLPHLTIRKSPFRIPFFSMITSPPKVDPLLPRESSRLLFVDFFPNSSPLFSLFPHQPSFLHSLASPWLCVS